MDDIISHFDFALVPKPKSINSKIALGSRLKLLV